MKKFLATLLLICVVISMLTVVAYATSTGQATSTDIFDSAASIFNTLRSRIIGISSAAAGVGLVIALCMWGFGNTKQSQAGWEWAKRIVIAYIAIASITAIISTIQTLAGI